MSEFLKGNFKTKKEVKESTEETGQSSGDALIEEVRKKALSSLGGSMVYMDRTDLEWDGSEESDGEK